MNNPKKQFKVFIAEDSPTPVSASCELDAEGHCITCSDEAQPATVISVDLESGTAIVTIPVGATFMTPSSTTVGAAFMTPSEEIDITLVDDVEPGSVVLVHGGVAIANITDEASNE